MQASESITSESITKAYDQKCNQLRHQFSKDTNARAIDKMRATVKDLHSRVSGTIQAVDFISRRIKKLRDELQPQLAKLWQGLIRMWKAMLECHQSQIMTISSAYQAKNSMPPSGSTDFSKQVAMNLRDEVLGENPYLHHCLHTKNMLV
ncbi:hypothetical protein KSP40_PGU011075 [Platanthera guangdongensis]|uniref:DUF632 domain-containing protein n=1 Tax=Platanthera guangdongensis TaxID=2320717 RepID=A0ABR2N3G2_9ASPA